MSSREEGAPVCKAHPVPMTTLGSEVAYPALPLSGFLPNCASVYLPANWKLDLHLAVWVR